MAEVDELLMAAGIASTDVEARKYLRTLLRMLKPPKNTAPATSSTEINRKLDSIRRKARDLAREITALKSDGHSHMSFWLNDTFGPIHMGHLERAGILDTLSAVETAARLGRNPVRNRKPNYRKQRVVDMACTFYARFSPNKPSMTETGGFMQFARAFHAAVTGNEDEVNVTRQARKAVQKLAGKPPLVQKSQKSGDFCA